jgi:hypothetical protein
MGSSFIDRGFGKEKSLDAKQAHLMGIDSNRGSRLRLSLGSSIQSAFRYEDIHEQ